MQQTLTKLKKKKHMRRGKKRFYKSWRAGFKFKQALNSKFTMLSSQKCITDSTTQIFSQIILT